MSNYTVKPGDCLSSIAFRYGFRWQTLWDHPNNSSLKNKRKNPNVLFPGDMVFIPESEAKYETCATGQRHKFVMHGALEELNLVVKREGHVLACQPYTIVIDGEIISGKTDDEGRIKTKISPMAKKGKLTVGEGFDRLTCELNLGHMDPIDEIAGVQAVQGKAA